MTILATIVLVGWGVTAASLMADGFSLVQPRLFTNLLFFWGMLVSSALSALLAFLVILDVA